MDMILSSTGGVLIVSVIIGAIALLLRPSSSSANFEPVHVPSQSAVLVTGGYRGIGKSTAYHLLSKGYFVFVTVRSDKHVEELQADENAPFPILLDVTNDNQVGPAVERVTSVLKDKQKSLVAIVNNAGINPEGDEYQKNFDVEDELCDPTITSRVLETNVVGVMRITRAFLPLLLPQKNGGGRIIHVGSYFGSIAGKLGLRQASYEASKFALEGLTDNMRRGLQPKGIHVANIKPGNIATDMNSYGEVGPEAVAKDIEHAIGAPNPRPRYYPGKLKGYNVRFVCWLYEILPTFVSDNL